jgi:hypothetical protein
MDVSVILEKFPVSVLGDLTFIPLSKLIRKEDYVHALTTGILKIYPFVLILVEVRNEGINILVKRMKRTLLEDCTKYVPEKVLNKGNKATRISSTNVMVCEMFSRSHYYCDSFLID